MLDSSCDARARPRRAGEARAIGAWNRPSSARLGLQSLRPATTVYTSEDHRISRLTPHETIASTPHFRTQQHHAGADAHPWDENSDDGTLLGSEIGQSALGSDPRWATDRSLRTLPRQAEALPLLAMGFRGYPRRARTQCRMRLRTAHIYQGTLLRIEDRDASLLHTLPLLLTTALIPPLRILRASDVTT